MFSKSAVLLLLCLQAFGLMSGIGGLVMVEEGLAANCNTQLVSAKMGQIHGHSFLNICLNVATNLSDCNISLLDLIFTDIAEYICGENSVMW